MKKLQVSLRRSLIGISPRQRVCIKGLGLRRINQVRVLENTPAVRGLIRKVLHLVDVSEVEADASEASASTAS